MASLPSEAHAGPVWPDSCDVGPVLSPCPAGDTVFNVLMRDQDGNPVPGVTVSLGLEDCPGLRLVPLLPWTPYQLGPGPVVAVTSDAQGRALFALQAGGTCRDGVPVIAGGLPIRVIPGAASPDQNGDWVVTDADINLLTAKIGATDPTGDLDGDGMTTYEDLAALLAHIGHSALLTTPTSRPTWGRLKLLYR